MFIAFFVWLFRPIDKDDEPQTVERPSQKLHYKHHPTEFVYNGRIIHPLNITVEHLYGGHIKHRFKVSQEDLYDLNLREPFAHITYGGKDMKTYIGEYDSSAMVVYLIEC